MFPLESAEQNIWRLTSDPSVLLPFPDADPAKDVQQIKCQECSAKFCSENCLLEAENKYHKFLCKQSLPNQPLDQINEIWK